MERVVGEEPHVLDGGADHEQSPVEILFVKGNRLTVGREGRPTLVAVRLAGHHRRVTATDALHEQIPATIDLPAECDRRAIG